MRRVYFLVPIILFVGVSIALGLSLISGRDPSAIPSALIEQPAPRFALPGLDGEVEALSTKHLTGQVALVNIFASWCVPCLAEHPFMMRLAQDGYTVFGINYRDTESAASAWLKRNGNPYSRVGFDSDGRAGIEWGVTGVPETFIVDRTGLVRYKHVGPVTAETFEREILPRIRVLQE